MSMVRGTLGKACSRSCGSVGVPPLDGYRMESDRLKAGLQQSYEIVAPNRLFDKEYESAFRS